MKKYTYLLFLLMVSNSNILGQVKTLSENNFIYTSSPKKAVQENNFMLLLPSEVNQSVTYFDGLGRSMNNIVLSEGTGGSDIVTYIGYDDLGRQSKEYLPYARPYQGNALWEWTALTLTNQFYNTSKYEYTLNPFSEKQFDASPLNRVLQQAAPGNDWDLTTGHTIKLNYESNIVGEVKAYTVALSLANSTYFPSLSLSTVNGGFYLENQLQKTVTKDENWIASDGKNRTTEEFKNKEGQIVLKRTYSNYTNPIRSEVAHDTYYIHDKYGNLTYVLPPKSEGLTDVNTLNNLCYQYKYDYRNRLVEKKLPGKEWEYFIYDKLDRPILTQDANLRLTKKWLFTKYDVFGRVVYTGDYVNATVGQITRAEMQTLVDATTILFETKLTTGITINGTTVYYSNNAFPNINTANINLFTINYYDNYTFDNDGLALPSTSYGQAVINYDDSNRLLTKGLSTGSKVRILGTNTWTTSLVGYDAKGRSIYLASKNNYLSTTNTVKSQLSFSGQTLETTSTHLKGGTTTTIVDVFTYNHVGSLLSQKQTINSQAQETIVENTYDELGQLVSKGVGGKTTVSNRLQTIDYKYNIRGWLKNINDVNTIGGNDLFAFQIKYNDIADVTKKLYNGNISQTLWKTNNTDSTLKNYTYTYDALNRLTDATDNLGKFNESLGYDKNGNITNLNRLGNLDVNATTFGTMDNLVYTYDNANTGNQLIKVEDTGSTEGFKNGINSPVEYTYDNNGNMLTDLNKGIAGITYNYLNLPTQVTIGGANINYVYDATGAKQQKIVSGISTDYAGVFIYENNVMKFFSQPEGYVAKNATTGNFDYIYQYKDHLGNVRLSYGDGNNDGLVNTGEIVEESNYYPFGLKQKGYNNVTGSLGNATAQKYKYNGKELQDELGLNMYDYEFRQYMPDIGRFASIDPMADFVNYQSQYVYGDNNPVMYMDENGLGIFRFLGNLFGRAGRSIGSIFAGNSCSCKSGGSTSLADSWNRPDFPGVNTFINNLFDGNGGSNNNRTATVGTSGEGQRGKLEANELSSVGIAMGESSIEPVNINIPNYYTPAIKKDSPRENTPMFNGRAITSSPIKINKTIEFDGSSTKMKINYSDRTINALVKTLIDYPQLVVSISVNVSVPDDPSINWSTGVWVDKQKGTLNSLQSGRAKAIMNFLIKRGVKPGQINTQRGSIQTDLELPRTTFKLINTRR